MKDATVGRKAFIWLSVASDGVMNRREFLKGSAYSGCLGLFGGCALFQGMDHPIGMVHGTIADSEKYEHLHPRFRKAFEFLRSHDLATLPLGRNEIDGDDIYANVMDVTLATWDANAKLEVHRQYFDIHVPVSGDEVDGFVYDTEHAKADGFNVEKDYVLFQDPNMSKVALKKGEFVVFYPNVGAHAPNKTEGAPRKHRKIVVKVRSGE